ncbi:MAG: sigma-70 family RNA polymerase sigma factor [Chloroflexi bacterium]|nr:sigma-70 family RNA polymerase sigma factor [Chloroflexota bacterium]
MAYTANKIDERENLTLLLGKDNAEEFINKEDLSELFGSGDEPLKNLRMYYFEVRENQNEVADNEISPSPAAPKPKIKPTNGKSALAAARGESVDAVGLYLKEMSRVPLLTNEEEISIAKRIESAKKAKKKLGKLNGRSSAKLREKFTNQIEDGLSARAHLINANTRLVVSIAKKYLGRGVPFLDLIQEGNLGLMKAVKKYDYTRGFRFSTYATWWIRQTITRSIADQGRTIRVPVHMIDRIRLLYKTAHRLEQRLGQPPSVEELAEAMSLNTRKVQWMLRVSWLPLSLESPIGDDEDSELGMFVEDKNTPSPGQTAYHNLLSAKVEEVLATLSPREARILRLRFGLENGTTYTLEEVGEKFGLTRERIRQIEGKALRRLRHPMRSRQLREYL